MMKIPTKVKGKIALVTGASSGFGKGISERLALGGAKVVVADISEKEGKAFTQSLNDRFGAGTAHFVRCDVAKSGDIDHLFKECVRICGRVDIVFNNAGISELGVFIADEEPKANWREVIEIDLHAVIDGTQQALYAMRKQNPPGGVIVNTASMAGFLPGVFMPVYCAAKFGVVGFTRSLDKTLTLQQGVRVVGIAPTFSPTPMLLGSKDTSNDLTSVVDLNGTVPVELVIDAYVLALEDESLCGDIIRVTRKYGIDVVGRKEKL